MDQTPMHEPSADEPDAEVNRFPQGAGTTAGKRALVVVNEKISGEHDLPVLELVVSHEENPQVLDVKSTKPVAGRRKGWRPSSNWPPLARREIGGIVVAIVGTILLGVLASKGVANSDNHGTDHEEGRLGTEAAAAILIALGIALINLAHVVGLVLFQSVRYDGIFSRFFARLSLIGTPIAVVVCAVLVL